MKEMAADTFKAKCLAIMDQVLQSGEPVLITKHGKPVAKLVPAEQPADDIFADYLVVAHPARVDCDETVSSRSEPRLAPKTRARTWGTEHT